MALVKTVEMRILADAGDAQAKLDEMDAKAKDLDSKAIKIRFRVDTAEGRAQLEAIKAKAGELGYKDVDIKVRVDGKGRAVADLMALKHEVDSLDRRALGGGLLNRMIGGAGGGIGGGTGGIGPIPALPLPVLAAAVPAAGALGAELVAVASGFAAAAAGAGSFALLAVPAVKNVETAYQSLSKAQSAYSQAVTKERIDPTKANQAAVKTAQDNMMLAAIAFTKLPASEREAVGGIQRLKSEFGKMSKAFAPTAFKVFGDGLKVIGNLLPHLTQFAKPFADSLDGLFRQLDKFTRSKGFSDFMAKFSSLTGPATTAIGEGIGKVAGSIGHLLTIFSGKDVAHAINIAFGGIAGTINGIASGINRFRENWDGMSRAAVKSAHGIAVAFDTARHFFASGGHDIAQDFDQARHAVAGIGHGIASAFSSARHAAASAAHGIASAFDNVRHSIAAKFDGIRGTIAGKFAGAGSWLASAAHGMASAFDNVRHDIAAKFDGIRSTIAGAFAGAAGWLIGAGRAIIDGLISGIESGIGKLGSILGGIGGFIASHKGPLDYDRQLLVPHGKVIMGGLMAGIESQRAALGRQLAGVTGDISRALGGPGYDGGGGGMQLHVHFHGITPADKYATAQQVHQVLRDYKRDRGGAALGLG